MGRLYTKNKTSEHFINKDSRRETLVYVGLWTVLFLTPLLSIYIHTIHTSDGSGFHWNELFIIWKECAIFLVAFLLHNYLLAPLLIYQQRRVLYFSCMAALLALFVTVQCVNRPDFPDKRHHHFTEQRDGFDGPPPFANDFHDEGMPPELRDGDIPGMRDGRGPGMRSGRGPRGPRGPVIIGEHDVVKTIIFILMIGMNLGVKLYFRRREDQNRLAQLEHENLEQQLEYLKYQINPHFLMNTLNNIHALVDIDPEQAKETIVELSKIMRFVLYEGSKQKVPLRQELLFLENYIELMKMRVAEQVSITVKLPDTIPDREIPPLLLITFVENAFKHGVSYQQPSFIDIAITVEGVKGSEEGVKGSERNDTFLNFVCRNSKIPQTEDRHGGVGLQNARRRLDLLYADRYTLHIDDADNTYSVKLSLPL
jgi:hypothetical protein